MDVLFTDAFAEAVADAVLTPSSYTGPDAIAWKEAPRMGPTRRFP